MPNATRPGNGLSVMIGTETIILIGLLLFSMAFLLPPYIDSFVGDDFVQQWRIREFVTEPEQAYRVFDPYWTDWYYRPIQNLWILVNRLAFGLLPFGYYYLQLSWHLLSISLIFRLARVLNLGVFGAIGAAALFAVNGQHQLTVDWISSIGNLVSTCLSLAALVLFFSYYRGTRRPYMLAMAVGLSLLATLAHEQGIVLILFLVVTRLTGPRSWPVKREEWVAAGVLLASFFGYLAMQIARPNANIVMDDAYSQRIAGSILAQRVFPFLVNVLARWATIQTSAQGVSDVDGFGLDAILSAALIVMLTALLLVRLRRARAAIRVGISWTVMQLAFTYLALWSQRPELFDGRHLYSAWAGMCLVLGAAVDHLVVDRSFSSQRRLGRPAWLRTLVVLSLVGFLLLQAVSLHDSRQNVLALAGHVQRLSTQMKELLPEPTSQTRVFASRFILTPPYFAPAAAVWYEIPELSGGDLDALKEYSWVTDDFYLFDEQDGELLNLMPELQRHRKTILIWKNPPDVVRLLHEGVSTSLGAEVVEADVVVGPGEDRRLAVAVEPEPQGWTSLGYLAEVPEKSQLAVAVWGAQGQSFRIRVADNDGRFHTLYEVTVETDSAQSWQETSIALDEFAGRDVTIFLELRAAQDGVRSSRGYWANPRLVVD